MTEGIDRLLLPDLQADEAAALLALAQRCVIDGPGAFARFSTAIESQRSLVAVALVRLIPQLAARCQS